MKEVNALYGAILGDLAGQPYEYKYKGLPKDVNIHNPHSHITDDTIMLLASASSILFALNPGYCYRNWGKIYPGDFYGDGFQNWINDSSAKGDSWGNGCLMRLAPFAWANDVNKGITSVMSSHAHHDSLAASMKLLRMYEQHHRVAIANPALLLAPKGNKAKDTIGFIGKLNHRHNNVHQAIITTIEGGGDTDTNAAIIGELMNFKYGGITAEDKAYVESKLDKRQWVVLKKFNEWLQLRLK